MAKGAGPSAGAAAGAAGRKAMESTGKEAAGGGAASGSSSVRSGAYQGCRGGQIPDGRRMASRAANLASSAGRVDAGKPGLFEGGSTDKAGDPSERREEVVRNNALSVVARICSRARGDADKSGICETGTADEAGEF